MRITKRQKKQGLTLTPVVIIVGILIIIIGVWYWQSRTTSDLNGAMTKKDDASVVMEPKATTSEFMEKKENANVNEGEVMNDEVKNPPDNLGGGYRGVILAGTQAKVIEFNQADYDAALTSDKTILLYYYANWCPICRAEVPKMYAAFDRLTTDQVVAFRVNFNDNETDEREKALAREHGVAYQHTKVIIRNGQRVLKSPETWDEARYLSEINSLIP